MQSGFKFTEHLVCRGSSACSAQENGVNTVCGSGDTSLDAGQNEGALHTISQPIEQTIPQELIPGSIPWGTP